MKEFTIGCNDAGQRLDRFLAKAVPLLPASLAQKYIRLKRIKCNGKRIDRDTRLNEGDVLQLAGLTIRVLHTPGHTEGSVCLMVEDTLFSGDTLFMDSIGRTDFPGGSFPQIQKSLHRLMELPGNLQVLPGHGPASTIGHEALYNPFITEVVRGEIKY